MKNSPKLLSEMETAMKREHKIYIHRNSPFPYRTLLQPGRMGHVEDNVAETHER